MRIRRESQNSSLEKKENRRKEGLFGSPGGEKKKNNTI